MKINFYEEKGSFEILEPFYVIEYEKADYHKIVSLFLEMGKHEKDYIAKTDPPSVDLQKLFILSSKFKRSDIHYFVAACAKG